MYDSLSTKIAKQEGRFIYSAPRAKEFIKTLRKKERHPIEKCKKQLNLLVHSEIREMNEIGINYEAIRSAGWKVQSFLESEDLLTNKQLRSIFPAALCLVQNSDLIRHGKILGHKVTESQLERIFDVTRKTIRKWKRILQKHSLFSGNIKLGIFTRHIEGQPKRTFVEFPKAVESVSRLENHTKPSATFVKTPTLVLHWRILFTDGSWSNVCAICQSRYALEKETK